MTTKQFSKVTCIIALLCGIALTGCTKQEPATTEADATEEAVISKFSVSDTDVAPTMEAPKVDTSEEAKNTLVFMVLENMLPLKDYGLLKLTNDQAEYLFYLEDEALAKCISDIAIPGDMTLKIVYEEIGPDNKTLYNSVAGDLDAADIGGYAAIKKNIQTTAGPVLMDDYNFRLYKPVSISLYSSDGSLLVENVTSVDQLAGIKPQDVYGEDIDATTEADTTVDTGEVVE